MASRMRWGIGGLLFASTVVNYIDRQTLSVLAPHLKTEFQWTNSDFSLIVIAFRIAYAGGQSVAGRMLDWLGARRGLPLCVVWYSAAAMLTSLAGGLRSFAFFRFLLGVGEAGNWPGAAKTVAEWFPKSERGLATALFDSGSAVGAAVAPFLVIGMYKAFGTWRPVFLVTGALGFLWVAAWLAVYRREPPPIGDEEELVPRASWLELARMPRTWGIILGRSLTDPVWFFITDWFAIYLVSKGHPVENTLWGFWIPFLAADCGNFFGGGLSGLLIRRGMSVLAARKVVFAVCGVGMASLAFAVFTANIVWIVGLFAASTFCYAAWSTMALSLPGDLYTPGNVATVSGMSGTGAGIGTIVSTFLIGRVADRFSFEPILIAASLIPLAATVLVLLLVRPHGRAPVASRIRP